MRCQGIENGFYWEANRQEMGLNLSFNLAGISVAFALVVEPLPGLVIPHTGGICMQSTHQSPVSFQIPPHRRFQLPLQGAANQLL